VAGAFDVYGQRFRGAALRGPPPDASQRGGLPSGTTYVVRATGNGFATTRRVTVVR
jgi:hypothetical protein